MLIFLTFFFSVRGHDVGFYPQAPINFYAPSKFALKAMTQLVELELQHFKCNIKITVSLFINKKLF